MDSPINKDFWDSKYLNHETGWDLNQVSPPIKTYFEQITNKDLKILIPGGGNSHEAEYLFRQGFKNVTVVDISQQPLINLKKRLPQFPDSQLLHQDFFQLNDSFDLVVEQTFFCALDPKLRQRYVDKMHEILAPKGKIIGLLFDAPLNTEHPPFGGNKNEYTSLFSTKFEIKNMDPAYNSIAPRLGKEVFINFIKK